MRVYVLGQNVWRDEQEWPPANAKPRAFYLHSGGKAQTLDGDGSLDSTATDTDFTAKLVDVFPDGQALIVCEGIVRARYRGGLDKPELLEPGRTYAFDIHVGNTAVQFQPGHRIRLEASSSNFPRYDPNPNTGQDIATERRPVSATQQVAHGPQFPSALLLPIVEE